MEWGALSPGGLIVKEKFPDGHLHASEYSLAHRAWG
jgi:hypothetical protein